METVNILVIARIPDGALKRIQDIDGRVSVVDARDWFDAELQTMWPQWTVERYLGASKPAATSPEQRNRARGLDGHGGSPGWLWLFASTSYNGLPAGGESIRRVAPRRGERRGARV